MINYNKVLSNLEELKLDKIRTYLPNYLNSIKDKDISIVDILYELTEKEVEFKNQRASRIQVVVSAFPFEKEVRDFDFLYQPSVSKSQILDLESLRFLENKENIVFVGISGVGKTHLAVALGMAVAKKRYSVYFIPCHDLILNLKKAYNENRLEARLKHYAKYQLLIIDEIGYLPLDRTGA
ncbi:ATP-binding protein, partial [Candidatus Cetobacterium colombiensis]